MVCGLAFDLWPQTPHIKWWETCFHPAPPDPVPPTIRAFTSAGSEGMVLFSTPLELSYVSPASGSLNDDIYFHLLGIFIHSLFSENLLSSSVSRRLLQLASNLYFWSCCVLTLFVLFHPVLSRLPLCTLYFSLPHNSFYKVWLISGPLCVLVWLPLL